ncbi:MAG: aspartyl protease family protein [Salinivirgaceae bacterium]|jgi:hypothetical protein|nr:aspartyl protease family protein [Salinivirgaceae bacterium]
MTLILPIEFIKLEDKSYHLMIEAEFPNHTMGDLIIDTGASKSVFDQEFVSPFIKNLEEIDDENSSGINAMITQAQAGIIPLVKFKTLEIKDFQALLLDLSHVNNLYKKYTSKQVAGLIGSDFLVNHKAVIDYGQKKISLKY